MSASALESGAQSAVSAGDVAADTAPSAFDFDERVRLAPKSPGVYLMKDRRGKIVYIGKAGSLQARLNQYRLRQDDRFFVRLLRDILGDIEVVVTQSEKEALLLENELVKRHQPRFNVLLKDDKNFIHLRIGQTHAFPRLQVVRNAKDDGARYFGPYASASAARATLRQVNRYFQLRTCTDSVFRNRQRPCLEYQIQRCPAPCVLPVAEDTYRGHVHDVGLFLTGRRGELVEDLRTRMAAAAEREDFETAARLRDQWRGIDRSLERQNVKILDQHRDLDVIGLYREGARMAAAVLRFRRGVLLGAEGFALKEQEFPDDEVLAGFLMRRYDQGAEIPDQLLVGHAVDSGEILAEWLTEERISRGGAKRKVELVLPKRGPKKQLIAMAVDNAKQVFTDRMRGGAGASTLDGLKRRLGLRELPQRIECYDVSNISGTDPVASMVVFTDGLPDKSAYRSFKVRSKSTPDDFAMMYEILCRRLERIDQDGWERPDLLVVDGGPPQLRMAVAALSDRGVHDVEVVGLAKARTQDSVDGGRQRRSPERVWLPEAAHPIILPQTSNEVFLLTRLRDEAHRFAITHHRKRRRGRTLTSRLDQIDGVGPARRRALLRHFGSVSALARADPGAISAVPGIGLDLARRIAEIVGAGPSTS
ncbi:MAG: excinuclease ABC subunit UvrC [Myxococcales bacterium]|nr:excinuclease ABC subunit UvrC [Myxococcales bacterium]